MQIRLRMALRVMTVRQRQVMILRLKGLSQRQIATLLNVSQPTVHEHIIAAQKRARKRLGRITDDQTGKARRGNRQIGSRKTTDIMG